METPSWSTRGEMTTSPASSSFYISGMISCLSIKEDEIQGGQIKILKALIGLKAYLLELKWQGFFLHILATLLSKRFGTDIVIGPKLSLWIINFLITAYAVTWLVFKYSYYLSHIINLLRHIVYMKYMILTISCDPFHTMQLIMH